MGKGELSAAAARVRKIRQDRKSRGLCPYCGDEPIPGKSLCARHASIQRMADLKHKGRDLSASVKHSKDEYVPTPENRWVTTFSIDCPTVWTIAGEQT